MDRLRRRGISRAATAEQSGERSAGRCGEAATIVDGVLARLTDELEAHADSRPSGSARPCSSGRPARERRRRSRKSRRSCLARESPRSGDHRRRERAGEDDLARVAEAMGLRLETAFFSGQLARLARRRPAHVISWTRRVAPRGPREGLSGLEESWRALDDVEVVLVIPRRRIATRRAALGDDTARSASDARDHQARRAVRPGRIVELAGVIGAPVARVTAGREARGAAFSGAVRRRGRWRG